MHLCRHAGQTARTGITWAAAVVALMCVVSGQADTLYVTTHDAVVSTLVRVDDYLSPSPTFTQIGDPFYLMSDIAIDPESDEAFACDLDGNLFQIDLADASRTLIGNTGYNLVALAVGPGGQLYAGMSGAGTNLLEIDRNTAAVTLGLNMGVSLAGDLAWDATTGLMYASTNDATLIAIDLATGAITAVGDMPRCGGLAVDSGGNMFAGCLGDLLAVDKTSGQSWSHGASPAPIGGLAVRSIPEPASLALLACGLLFRPRRKR